MTVQLEEHLVPSLKAQADVLDFEQIALSDLACVGGKNASLGELFRALRPKGVGVVDGFATTARAYRRLLAECGLEGKAASDLRGCRRRRPGRARDMR